MCFSNKKLLNICPILESFQDHVFNIKLIYSSVQSNEGINKVEH